MAGNKTKATKAGVEGFIAKIGDETRRNDCETLIRLLKKATKQDPVMWGSMVGFGNYHYRYESGREGDMFIVGFASRKSDLTIYIMNGLESQPKLMAKLGKYRTGKSCLYVKKLADIDTAVLEQLITGSVRAMREKYDCS